MMDLIDILRIGVNNKASDIHLTVGRAPSFRINGRMRPIDVEALTKECTMEYAKACTDKDKFERLMTVGEVDFSMSVEGLSRFRVNIFFQRGSVALVFRVLASEIPTLESLKLPPAVKEICKIKEGLILVT